MSWRTVVISNRCKLDVSMGYLVVRGEETKRVFLDEIAILLIENSAVSLTGCLLEALTEKKIKTVFCDSKRNPQSELIPCHGSHDSSLKIRTQAAWSPVVKARIWREIIAEKIRTQSQFLNELGKTREYELLSSYLEQIEPADATNREGHAAKVYFNALFGMSFTRSADSPINSALNYGYSLLLSAINREVAVNGYLTQLGLFHDNMFNHFNLSCDLMEPFRILVDRYVVAHLPTEFGTPEKHAIWGILNDIVYINNTQQTVLNAIKIYTRSVFDAVNDNEPSEILFLQD